MSNKKIIQHAIERLYGPCPVGDFLQANEWASHLDWERVKDEVEDEHPEFEWSRDEAKVMEVAEALIFEVRGEMLHHAGESE